MLYEDSQRYERITLTERREPIHYLEIRQDGNVVLGAIRDQPKQVKR